MRNRILFLMLIVFISFITNKELNAQTPVISCNGTINCTGAEPWSQVNNKAFLWGSCLICPIFATSRCCTNGICEYMIDLQSVYIIGGGSSCSGATRNDMMRLALKFIMQYLPEKYNIPTGQIAFVNVKIPKCMSDTTTLNNGDQTRSIYSCDNSICCQGRYQVALLGYKIKIQTNNSLSNLFANCTTTLGVTCNYMCDALTFPPTDLNVDIYGKDFGSSIDPCLADCFWRLDGNSNVDTTKFMGSTNNVPVIFKANNTEKMRILTNGNIGIGTSTPTAKLEVNGSLKATTINTTGNIVLATGAKVGIGVASPTVSLDVNGAINTTGNIVLATGAKVGIGVASPTVALDVSGAIKATTLNTTGNVVLATGGKIGIGVANPTVPLDVNGAIKASTFNTTGNIVVDTTGKVGIGIASPTVPLDVKGAIKATTINTTGNIVIDTTGKVGIGIASPSVPLDVKGAIKATTLNTTGNIVVDTTGKVGIGVANPTQKLEVNGNIKAEAIKATGNISSEGTICAKEVNIIDIPCSWPDYVLANNYNLLSFDELEKSINENGTLPGVPSADEVNSTGIEVGKMQAILLKKVEELTLYVIQLNKDNQKLQKRNKDLEKKLKSIKVK